MFEDSLFESTPRAISARSRWTAAASIALQGCIASLLVVVPLLHTDLLPNQLRHLQTTFPLPVVQPPKPPRIIGSQTAATKSTAIPILGHAFEAPRRIPGHIDLSPQPTAASTPFTPMGDPSGLPDVLSRTTDSAHIPVAAAEKKPGPVRVSAGVSAGLLLSPIRPVYPPIAKAVHLEGSVVVEAIISKTGSIESLHVVRGPAMLQAAALDAIRAARYQPFRLNGEPTEVQTTITVNFVLGG